MQRSFIGLSALALSLLSAGCLELPVSAVQVGEVVLSHDDLSLSLGDSAQLVASVMDDSGEPLPDRAVNWSSNNPRVAVVDEFGLVRAAGAGFTSIVAESGGRSASATVTVSVSLTSIRAGVFHTCGITSERRIACWGRNRWGELGDSTLFSNPAPVLVASWGTEFTRVAIGSSHTCALSVGPTVCWGANYSAQLGMGSADAGPHPQTSTVSGPSFTWITAGDRHTCALGSQPTPGTAYCWGGGGSGQLGNGQPTATCPMVVDEPCNTVPEPVAGPTTFESIDAGTDHTCGLAPTGAAYCWGSNQFGQLGDSSDTSRSAPVPVAGNIAFRSLSVGTDHACGIARTGQAYCWGSNGFGRLGNGGNTPSNHPVSVTGGIAFESLSAGSAHTCGLTSDGTAYCWGLNDLGQLGQGSPIASGEPIPVSGGIKFASISAGWSHTCGMSLDGFAYCWGWNNNGQLGVSGGSRSTPTLVAGQD
ncbi:MAG: hypothetical protein GTN78_05375 [Gemmatimonadales bacterium]|nr:hypothetical protein [Gemmatimonadales bacterium]NIN12726.1 hypothetical protein [Gemmatimonadales bacterium]NIQ99617.1 hypothetical protein [Gemmatimonadales bacterium]NIS64174.1 hypothetical protein [Gemmatimonadales bacterium]